MKICQFCGAENDEGNLYCSRCRQPFQAPMGLPHVPQSIPNHLVEAILVTIFCCIPFGIVGIVYAAQVNGKLAAGDVAGALEASETSHKWSTAGLVIGLIVIAVKVILTFGGGM